MEKERSAWFTEHELSLLVYIYVYTISNKVWADKRRWRKNCLLLLQQQVSQNRIIGYHGCRYKQAGEFTSSVGLTCFCSNEHVKTDIFKVHLYIGSKLCNSVEIASVPWRTTGHSTQAESRCGIHCHANVG